MIALYSAEDARGFLKTSIRDDNPIDFLEHEIVYWKSFEKTEEIMHLDFLLQIGKAKIKREGKNNTIVNFRSGLAMRLSGGDFG